MEPKFKIIEFEDIPSTSEKAKELAIQNESPWTVVLARQQSNGHGRKGEAWFSPEGGLYFSVILPKSSIADLQTITILAAFVISKIIKDDFNLEPLIKLPNDILLDGKKVCGVLTENVIMGDKTLVSIIGVGLDTNIKEFPNDLKDISVSLRQVLFKEIDNNEILEKILSELKNQLEIINQNNQ
ncbi:MAG: biotin--[acetyl-CoA-carboxylase] ligase [Candidatus Paceibacterota bacterium]